MKYADLHTHTIYSDGSGIPSQNVKDAVSLGTNLIAITDHDTTLGYSEAKAEANRWGIQTITGVEITTSKYHILGYGFDIENKQLQELLRYSRECQENRLKERIDKLDFYGIPITFEKVKTHFPKSRLGKLNLIDTMLLDKECHENIGDLTPEEIYDTYLGKKGLAGKIKKTKQVRSKEAIDAIHKAGGIAVIAHPFKEMDDIDELQRLVKKGIDGLEVQPNYGEENNKFKKYALEKKLIITYGSDYHGPRFRHRPLLSRNGNIVKWNE